MRTDAGRGASSPDSAPSPSKFDPATIIDNGDVTGRLEVDADDGSPLILLEPGDFGDARYSAGDASTLVSQTQAQGLLDLMIADVFVGAASASRAMVTDVTTTREVRGLPLMDGTRTMSSLQVVGRVAIVVQLSDVDWQGVPSGRLAAEGAPTTDPGHGPSDVYVVFDAMSGEFLFLRSVPL